MNKKGKSKYIFYHLPFYLCCEDFLLTFALIVPENIVGDPGGQSTSHQFQVTAAALSSIFVFFIPAFSHFFRFFRSFLKIYFALDRRNFWAWNRTDQG